VAVGRTGAATCLARLAASSALVTRSSVFNMADEHPKMGVFDMPPKGFGATPKTGVHALVQTVERDHGLSLPNHGSQEHRGSRWQVR